MESNRGDERCGRHTLQSTAAGTHTQPCLNTNTQMEEEKLNPLDELTPSLFGMDALRRKRTHTNTYTFATQSFSQRPGRGLRGCEGLPHGQRGQQDAVHDEQHGRPCGCSAWSTCASNCWLLRS
ncbi:elongation factor 1-gamma (EF-1-gamma) [Trypanosoma cruzi cruzi]|nr:elongation factor 1-gamma (EF-1-gamma) [Trypanosoma cruzi cruzi]